MQSTIKRKRRSLKRLIVAVTIVISMVSAGGLTAFYSNYIGKRLKDGLKMKADALANIISANLESPLDFDDADAAEGILRGIKKDKDLSYFLVLKKDGTVFTQVNEERSKGIPRKTNADKTEIFETAGKINIVQPVFIRGEQAGVVQIGFSTVRMKKNIDQANQISIIIAFLFVVALLIFFLIIFRYYIFNPIRSFVLLLKEIGSGDLRSSLTHVKVATKEFGLMYDALEQARNSMHGNVQAISSAADKLTRNASELERTTVALSATAANQASAISETSGTVEEMRQTGEHSSKRAQGIVKTAAQSVTISEKGRSTTRDSLEQIKLLQDQVDSIATNIQVVASELDKAGEIITSVNNVAEQSNILAINASIEADQAGQHGRGFAVVAAEMSSLSTESKKATISVKNTLQTVLKGIQETVSTAKTGQQGAERSVNRIENTESVIATLAQAINDTSNTARQIADSAEQQLVGLVQVVTAMESIQSASYEAVDNIGTVKHSSNSLLQTAKELKDLVTRYRLDE
ncbi:MAG: hypothetical protein GY847_12850 [Proteobacteria bacterium]|nr:hypothetical protein [Pseudomonadota bacterium]